MIRSMSICAVKKTAARLAGWFRRVRGSAGHTLIEMVIAVAIVGTVVPMIVMMLNATSKGFTNFEAASSMKQLNQNSLNRIYLRLNRSKRLFENDTFGNALLARVNTTGLPAAVSGSKLPTIISSGSFSASSATFSAAAFGNRLFFAYLSATKEMPVSGNDIWRVDVYKFAGYYLTASGASAVNGTQAYNLFEFESIPYADCSQITALTTTANRKTLTQNLISTGIVSCLLASTTDYTKAIQTINSDGTLTVASSDKITVLKTQILTKAQTGIMGRNYNYGISPNTSVWANAKASVPLYAAASSSFPGGLEVGIVGGANGRQVLVRSVAVAQGERNSLVFNDMSVVSNSRDIW